MPIPARLRAPVRAVVLLLVAVLVSGCQMRLGADVTIDADGAGTFELLTAADGELVGLLADAGVDLRAGLEEALAAAPEWEVEETATDDGGLELVFRTTFDDPSQLGTIVDDLHAGLDGEDGAFLRDLRLSVTEDGAVDVSGDAGVLLPETTGAIGPEVGFDGDDLAALLAERGDELVRADLRITLPAAPVAHDADTVEGRSLTWALPVGEMRSFEARSEIPPDRTLPVAFAVAGAALLVAAVSVVLLRRRGSRRAGRRAERAGV